MINVDVFLSFRNDLRDGMTLENALRKYDFNLREVFDFCHRRNLDSQYRFIYLLNGSFVIRRVVDGKQMYYFRCRELDDAVRIRDKLIECDWDKSKIPEIKMELGL